MALFKSAERKTGKTDNSPIIPTEIFRVHDIESATKLKRIHLQNGLNRNFHGNIV